MMDEPRDPARPNSGEHVFAPLELGRIRGLAGISALIILAAPVVWVFTPVEGPVQTLLGVGLVFVVVTQVAALFVLLLQSRLRLASHLILATLFSVIWTVLFVLDEDPLVRFDTVVYLFGHIVLVVMLTTRLTVLVYGVANEILLVVLVWHAYVGGVLSRAQATDVLLDTTVSLVVAVAAGWFLLSIVAAAAHSVGRAREQLLEELTGSRALIEQLWETSERLTASVVDSQDFTKLVSASAENQSSSLLEMQQAVRTMQRNSQELAKRSQAISTATDAATKLSVASRTAMQQTRERLDEMAQQIELVAEQTSVLHRARQVIDDVVSQIVDLAYRSRILAVNASIQAAKAGVAGRGFKVVATEVRQLAGGSEAAVKMVRERLSQIQRAVDLTGDGVAKATTASTACVAAADKTGQAVDEVATVMQSIAGAAQEIDELNSDQAEGMDVITVAIDPLVQAGEELAGGNAQLIQVLSQLREVAEELSKTGSSRETQ